MTIVEPISDLQWGKGDWQDYINNWREKDAEYLQARTILRYHNATDRTAQWPTPSFGQVTYNETSLQVGPGVFVDRPEMYSKQHNKWVPLLMLDNITSTKDDSAGVALSHKGAGGKGVQFQPAQTLLDNPINVMNGVLYVDTDSVDIKTGAKTAKFTTDGTNLISDTPISAPSFLTGGTLSVTGGITAGSFSAPLATLTNISMVGTLTGGILNGTSGTIGGVQMGTAGAHGSGGVRADTQGFHAQQGAFYGDASGAVLRQRNPSGGAYGTAYMQVTSGDVNFAGNNVYMYPYLRIMGGKGVPWHNSAGTHVAWISPTIVSGGDPGAGNYPDGTIWVQP